MERFRQLKRHADGSHGPELAKILTELRGQIGRFTIAQCGDTAVLAETVVGLTWVLDRGSKADARWVPVSRRVRHDPYGDSDIPFGTDGPGTGSPFGN